MEFGYAGIKSGAHTKYGKILGEGTDIPIDLRNEVNTHLNFSVAKLLYTYSFYHNNDVEMGLSFGIHHTKIDYELSVNMGEQEKDKVFKL